MNRSGTAYSPNRLLSIFSRSGRDRLKTANQRINEDALTIEILNDKLASAYFEIEVLKKHAAVNAKLIEYAKKRKAAVAKYQGKGRGE